MLSKSKLKIGKYYDWKENMIENFQKNNKLKTANFALDYSFVSFVK